MDRKIIAGAGGLGKGSDEPHTPVEAPDTLHSIAYARIVDLISEGEIGGMTLKDIFLDETPLQNEDDTFNFKGVTVDMRVGTQDQLPLAGFPEVESETAVGVPLTADTPWTHSFTNTEITGIRITLAVASLLEVDTETGDTNGYRVAYEIDLKVDGGPFNLYFSGAFDGKASSQYQRSHIIELPHADDSWTVRVRRTTPDTDSSYIQDDTSVISYTELIAAKLAMPNSAVVGMVVDASQFRTVPNRAYRPYGRIIRVPSNYNVETREYTGIWDGTFQLAVSDNPAWVYYDMATHYRYGLGRFIADAQVDKWALYAIGQYCDELVDDGLGGSEPRFTCNIYLQKAADAYKVMQDLASVFRGISYWAAGKIVAIADKPADPVYTFNNSNVLGGRFSYQGSSRQARHTVALVSWSDPKDFGRGKVEYVPDEEGIARYGIQQLQITAIGATSQGQAHRCGLWALLSERLETNGVTFGVGLDGSIPQPGHIIRIADRLRDGARRGGRVRTATTSVITPDVMPAVSVGFNLTVILPTGVSQTRPVSAVGADTISVSPAFDTAPLTDAAWMVESEEAPAVLYKVLGVTEDTSQKDITYTVMAVVHNPDKFAGADFGITVQQPPYTQKPPNTIAPPASVSITSAIVTDPTDRIVMTVFWPAVTNAVAYEVSIRRNGGNWSTPVQVAGTRYEVDPAQSGEYKASVKALSVTGLASLERLSDTVTVDPVPTYDIMLDEDTGEMLIDEDTNTVLYGEV